MSATLEPTGDRLVVEPIEETEVTVSGIIIPEVAREKPHRGIIIAVGPDVNMGTRTMQWADGRRESLEPRSVLLEVGDEVLYSKYGGTELKIERKPVVLLREDDIFCRVREATGLGEEAVAVAETSD